MNFFLPTVTADCSVRTNTIDMWQMPHDIDVECRASSLHLATGRSDGLNGMEQKH